jgi:hypothetical protein
MDNNETVLLSVEIDSRPMRLRVAKKDEEQVLLAAQMLNKRIEAFRKFGANEPIDRLSWAALDLAGDVVRSQNATPPVQQVQTPIEIPPILSQLESLLQNY